MGENTVVRRQPKTFYFYLRFIYDWPKNIDGNELLKKSNESVAENKIKKLMGYSPNISMKTVFMNTGTRKTREPHKFVI